MTVRSPMSKQVVQPENTANPFITFTTYAGNLNSPHFRTLHIWWRIQPVLVGPQGSHRNFLEEKENIQS